MSCLVSNLVTYTHTHKKRVVERTLAAVPLSLPPCIFSPRTTLLYYFLSTGNQIDFERRQAWVYGRQTFHHNLCGPIFPSLFLFLRVVCCRTWRKWVSGVRRTLFIPRKEMQSMTVSLFLIERQRGRHTSWLVRKEETISYNSSRISYLKRPISLRLPIVIYRRKKKRPNSLSSSSSSSSFFFSLHCYCAAGRTSRTNLAVYVGAVEAPLYMETMGKTEERRCIICPFDQRPAWNIPLRPTRRDGQDGQTDQLMTHAAAATAAPAPRSAPSISSGWSVMLHSKRVMVPRDRGVLQGGEKEKEAKGNGKWLGIERDGTVTNPSSWIDSEIAARRKTSFRQQRTRARVSRWEIIYHQSSTAKWQQLDPFKDAILAIESGQTQSAHNRSSCFRHRATHETKWKKVTTSPITTNIWKEEIFA